MMLPLYDRLRSAIRAALATQYALERDAAAIPLETLLNRTRRHRLARGVRAGA